MGLVKNDLHKTPNSNNTKIEELEFNLICFHVLPTKGLEHDKIIFE